MSKKCKLIASYGYKYGDDSETIVDLGQIDIDDNFEQFPLYGIAQSLISNPDQVDSLLSNLNVLYNQGVSFTGVSNITLRDLTLNIPIEGGWPNIEGIEETFNITYIDKRSSGRGVIQDGNNIKVYKNGLPILKGILQVETLVKKMGKNYLFSDDFIKVFNEIKKDDPKLTPQKFIERYIKSPKNFKESIEIKEGNDSITLYTSTVVTHEIDRINNLVNYSKSDLQFDFSEDLHTIIKELKASGYIKSKNNISENKLIIEFIIDYINDPTKFPETIKSDKKSISLKDVIVKEIDQLTQRSLVFNTPVLNRLYAIIKLKNGTNRIELNDLIPILMQITGLTEEECRKLTPKKIKSLINTQEIKADKEFPYRLDNPVYRDDDDTHQEYLFGFNIKSIYPDNLGDILKLDYSDVYDNFQLVDQYNGYNIFRNGNRYYVSQTVITNKTRVYGEPYNNINEAKMKIRQLINEQRLQTAIIAYSTSSSDDILTIFKDQYGFVPKEGQVIRVMTAERTPGSTISQAYSSIQSYKFSNFLTFLNDQKTQLQTFGYSSSGLTFDDIEKIKNTVKNAYQAREFLLCFYKIEKKMPLDDILEHIKAMKYKYYICVKGKNKQSYLREIDPKKKLFDMKDDNALVSSRKNNSIPKRELISDVTAALNNKLEGTGFQIIEMTQDDIATKYGKERATSNGFITGNEIIINTTIADITTPIHEYIHVFLGIIKALNYGKYRQIVERSLRAWGNTRNRQFSIERRLQELRELYPKMSEYDIQEELFGDLFAEYIYRNQYEEFMKTLEDKEFRETLSNIFELDEKSITFKNIWKMPLTSLSSILSDAKIESENRAEWFQSRFQLNRQAANWIRQGIEDHIIGENCE